MWAQRPTFRAYSSNSPTRRVSYARGEEPIPGTIDRGSWPLLLRRKTRTLKPRGQAEIRADLINMLDPDITQAVLLNRGTFAAVTTTRNGTSHPAHTPRLGALNPRPGHGDARRSTYVPLRQVHRPS